MLVHTKTAEAEQPSSPFAKKWQEIEKKQKRNANAKAKIDKLYQLFQNDILPEENKLVELLAQETHHLISFLPRKSFTQWQREELQAWIESNLDTLSHHPFGNQTLFNAASKEYADFLVKEAQEVNQGVEFTSDDIARMREMADEMFQGKKTFTDDELRDFMRDPSLFQQVFRDFIEEMENSEAKDEFYDDQDEHQQQDEHQHAKGHQYYQDKKKHTKLKSLFNSTNLNKLYKILANKLHPDKEKNEHLKAEKSELMAKLVKAKKNKDAYTLISMFHQFVPESELTLFDGSDEELTQALITLLNEKLKELDSENFHNKHSDGIQSMIWKKLSGRSKKIQQEKIDAHIADLTDSHTQLNYSINEVKTLKRLKGVLSERYEQRRFNPFEQANFSLHDLGELF